MKPLRAEVIVLKRQNFRETDLIVTFFSREFGKMAGIGFGARRSHKRFSNCLQLFALSQLFFSQRPNQELVRLEWCELIEGHNFITRDVKRFAFASYLAELTASLTAVWDKNVELFQLLAECLGLLNGDSQAEEAVRIFEIRFLTLLGYKLNLESCSQCGQQFTSTAPAYFQVTGGNLLCMKCSEDRSLKISAGTLRTLRYAQREPLNAIDRLRISRAANNEARVFLETFLIHLMHKRPKSLDMIQKLRNRYK